MTSRVHDEQGARSTEMRSKLAPFYEAIRVWDAAAGKAARGSILKYETE